MKTVGAATYDEWMDRLSPYLKSETKRYVDAMFATQDPDPLKVWIVSVEGDDYARAEVTAHATEAGAHQYLRELKEIFLADYRQRGYGDVPKNIEEADAEDFFSSNSDGVYFGIEQVEVQP